MTGLKIVTTLTPLIALSLACVLPLPVDAHLQGAGAELVQQPALVSLPSSSLQAIIIFN